MRFKVWNLAASWPIICHNIPTVLHASSTVSRYELLGRLSGSIHSAGKRIRSRLVTLQNLPTLPTSTLPMFHRPSPSLGTPGQLLPPKIISILAVSPNKLASRLNLLSPLPPSSVTAEPPPCHLRPRVQDDHPSSGDSALSHLVSYCNIAKSTSKCTRPPPFSLAFSLRWGWTIEI